MEQASGRNLTRRGFFALTAGVAVTTALHAADDTAIIDIHQHTNYSGRTDEQLIAHQRTMGITKTVLLPAGSQYGLAVGAGGNDSVIRLAKAHPKEYVFFANEVPNLPEAEKVLRGVLKQGAIGIGEQKFGVDCDSESIQKLASLAQEFRVPILLHFQHETYNLEYPRFYKILAKYPKVNFIGHAQTFWANIDKNADQKVLYPKTKVTPGGLTDRFMSDYPNFWADMSAGSGLNAMLRDEDHAREFLKRHQNRLLYGSDCNDKIGTGTACSGSQCIATIRRLADPGVQRKIFWNNAEGLMFHH